MNETVNKFLLAGDKFMPELHLKQPGFTADTARCQEYFTLNSRFRKKDFFTTWSMLHVSICSMNWLSQNL